MTNWRLARVAGLVTATVAHFGTARPFSRFGALLVLVSTFEIVSIANAQETNPLCDIGVAKAKWGKSNGLAVGGSASHLGTLEVPRTEAITLAFLRNS